MELIVNFLILGLFGGIAGDNTKVPHWENLECEVDYLQSSSSSIHSRTSQAGHKYLFSDELHSWDEARAECALYGGWLVNIGGVREQNCLVRFVDTMGWSAKYWTDGSNDQLYP